MTLPVHRRIADIARAEPGRTALIGFDADLAERTLSWGELAGSVRDAVDALRAALDPDVPSCVVVEAANTLAAATGIAAALAAEVPVFPLHPATPAAERDVLFGLLGRRYGHVHLMDAGNRPGPAVVSAAAPSTRDGVAAYLLATGASTGVPKISARPGPLRYDPARTPSLVIRQTGWRTGQRQLIVGPLYHAAPFTAFVDALLDMNTVVLQPFFAAQWTVDLVRRYRVEWVQLTPTHMREILMLAEADPAAFDSLRALLHTAAACDADTKRGWIDLLGPERVFELYGATEGIGVTLARGDEWLARPGTVGRGVLTQLRVLDDDGAPVAPGEAGTVFMRTPQRVGRSDYVNDQVVRTTPDGFATVGDRGRLDRDGYLYLEPRDHGTINVGGEKVDPNEVEAALLAHPAVVDAVALAVPHRTLGSVVGVQVVLRPEVHVRKADLAAHCGRRLAGYKIPKHFAFVDRLPRSAAGKIQRWRLAADHEGGAPTP
ncbi:bile acid-coenzyme A ligase [Saccharothrix saharensis]|uniref:Bile acid-coenzyme A ligase n=1 Tax=Saccharothrix saharensis TaxID=571190 RepID=A0A543JR65_9PSEU|nr:AMP-binding protein [Saccharothrix saharensis]TQM85332.1 bile acid-coenzyme A ligase [Saccharothrix saharensis]